MQVCLAEPDVLECHGVAGEDCYVLKVRVASPKELEKLIEKIRCHSNVSASTTNIVLSTFKEGSLVIPATSG
jgi:Lrp/AsnC family leucine-responsive transcriptional regulator